MIFFIVTETGGDSCPNLNFFANYSKKTLSHDAHSNQILINNTLIYRIGYIISSCRSSTIHYLA